MYKLIAPGLIPRLPLKFLHWQSHAGPLRSIETLHVELFESGAKLPSFPTNNPLHHTENAVSLDKFQSNFSDNCKVLSENIETTRQSTSTTAVTTTSLTATGAGCITNTGIAKKQRHQIPGLRQTPYLKVLFVRIDDNESYKTKVRAEIKEWINMNTPGKDKRASKQENHDAFEWLIVHVVVPNTIASTQPTTNGLDVLPGERSSSLWKPGVLTLLEKLRTDFNKASTIDRVAQIRIGINDVPYDLLPRVVTAAPAKSTETTEETRAAWQDLIGKLKSQILSSFDKRVTQYEEDIKEKDAQRNLPGWNFCTFFMLKEGLARGFESVGLVEDALVVYDELLVGLDTVVQEQALSGSAEEHGGSLLPYTQDLKYMVEMSLTLLEANEDQMSLDFSGEKDTSAEEIPVSPNKKPYRDMILANNVSVFDFHCYLFARQLYLLLRMGNAWLSREESLAKLKEQQESVAQGVAPRLPLLEKTDDAEKLNILAEICRRTLQFIPTISRILHQDLVYPLTKNKLRIDTNGSKSATLDSTHAEVIDNIVGSFAFSVAQQVLAQTSTKALPIPPSTLSAADGNEQKASIPEPKTMIHPARYSSLNPRSQARRSPNSGISPELGSFSEQEPLNTQFLKPGLEELATQRADLYSLSRNILEEKGKLRGWFGSWTNVSVFGNTISEDLEVKFDENNSHGTTATSEGAGKSDNRSNDSELRTLSARTTGIGNHLLKTALKSKDGFFRLYETLTDKALRHYIVGSHSHSVQVHMADLAVLKFHTGEYGTAASLFYRATPFFGEHSWSLLELSMLCMYGKCLKELNRKEDYVRVVLKLLSKAAKAERQRLEEHSSLLIDLQPYVDTYTMAVKVFLEDLVAIASTLDGNEFRLPLANFIRSLEIQGAPEYIDGQDSFALCLKINSLLPDEMVFEKIRLRLSGPHREIWVESREAYSLTPGSSSVRLFSRVNAPGSYTADQVIFQAHNLLFHSERDAAGDGLLKAAPVALFQRSRALNVVLTAARLLQLDKPASINLMLQSGWNDIRSCEIRIKAATGGLRLLMHEAQLIEPSNGVQFSKPLDHSVFIFGKILKNSSISLRLPFTVEQDLMRVSVKVEVSFTTEHGDFTFATMSTVPIGLPIGVNVQDVFKHSALFSRFTVTTATQSPIYLHRSEIIESDVFSSVGGITPSNRITIFPHQPGCLLYKITRKPGIRITARTNKTMYLRLHYSVLQDEIDQLIEKSIVTALDRTILEQYLQPLLTAITSTVRTTLTRSDLDRAALLGYISTAFVADVPWARHFMRMDGAPGTQNENIAAQMVAFVLNWQKNNTKIWIQESSLNESCVREILIPVDIPSIMVVHTANIQFQSLPPPEKEAVDIGTTVAICTNQLVSATLSLRWTRVWDTTGSPPQDLEFSYEVTAPTDTWLVGGRRKGHFIIPGVDHSDTAKNTHIESTPYTEACIPLFMSPLREGWLPYPQVEIREVRTEDGSGIILGGHRQCEIDFRNLGETVRVVQGCSKVTMSLDSSGPGGGPLILETCRTLVEGRIIL